MSARDRVIVTTIVGQEPAATFRLFTDEIGTWWRRGPRFQVSDDSSGVPRFVSDRTGRRLEIAGPGDEVFELGRVTVWDPPERLSFEFRTREFAPDEHTRVLVRFEAVEAGTRVTVEHSGWAGIPVAHRSKKGLRGLAFTNLVGTWWADQLVAMRIHAGRYEKG